MHPAKRTQLLASWPLWRLLMLFSIWHLIALGTFSAGFLLTRVELLNKNEVDKHAVAQSCSTQPPAGKMVWMIIDALRWDFVSNSSGRITGAPFGALPILETLACTAVSRLTCPLACSVVHHNISSLQRSLLLLQGPAALLTKFTADPPTTTMQRLKGLMTVLFHLACHLPLLYRLMQC